MREYRDRPDKRWELEELKNESVDRMHEIYTHALWCLVSFVWEEETVVELGKVG